MACLLAPGPHRQSNHTHHATHDSQQTYGRPAALKWFVYWRLFYLACSELFNFNSGEEWGVAHYLFVKPGGSGRDSGAAAAAAAATAAAATTAATATATTAGNGHVAHRS
jgi:hypothetical protein